MSFRNIIISWVTLFFIIFTIAIFIFFNNYYLKNTFEKFRTENKYSLTVTLDLIDEEKAELLTSGRVMASDDMTYYAFEKKVYIGTTKWNVEKNNVLIKGSRMNRYRFIQLANTIKAKVYGHHEIPIDRGIQLFDKKYKRLGNSKGLPKQAFDTGKEKYIKGVLANKNTGGTEISVIHNNGDDYFIKACLPVGGGSRWLVNNPPGILVVGSNLNGVFLDKLKKITNKDLLLIKKEKIITSTLYNGTTRVEKLDFDFEINKEINEKDGHYIEKEIIPGKNMGLSFVPLYDYDKKVIGYIGVGFYIDDVYEVYKKSIKRFIPFAIGSSFIIFIVLYIILKNLFNPFNRILEVIKHIKEGRYSKKIDTPAKGELKFLKDSINNLSTAVENRENELKDLNLDIQKKNEKLLELDKMKDEFLANTSHELRTPLNGIIGIAESLVDGAAGKISELVKENLFMVVSSGRRLASLVDNILDFSKMREREVYIKDDVVDIIKLTNNVILLSKPLLSGKTIKLINEIDKDVPILSGDGNRVTQILHNLIGNSIKFTKEGYIKVKSKIKNERVYISIEDTGIGIDKSNQEKIFDTFEQGDGSTARDYGGTGIGLSITRQLVELHGGKVTLESEKNKGAEFTFDLAIKRERSEEEKNIVCESIEGNLFQQPEEDLELNEEIAKDLKSSDQSELMFDEKIFVGKKILIVDDEPINLKILENHLKVRGFIVSSCLSGVEAVELVNKGKKFDLAILDVMMPKMSGYELCNILRKKFPSYDLPIILLTAKNQSSSIVMGLEAGANDYISKPFRKEELLARINTLLQLKTAVKEAIINENKYSSEKKQRKIAELLTEMTRSLTSTLILEKVFARLINKLSIVIEYDTAIAYYKFGNYYKVVGSHNFDVDYSESSLLMEYIKRNNIIENKKTFYLENSILDNDFYLSDKTKEYSFLVIPVLYNDEVIGLIVLQNDAKKAFSKSEIDISSTLIGQAGIAIENAVLFSKLKEKTELLSENLRKIKSIEKMASIMYTEKEDRRAISYTLAILTSKIGLNYKKAMFLEYDKSRNVLVGKNSFYNITNTIVVDDDGGKKFLESPPDDIDVEISKYERSVLSLMIDLTEENILTKAFFNGEIVTSNFAEGKLFEVLGYDMEEYSFCILPIAYKENRFGIIVLENLYGAKSISEEDIEVLKIFSSNLAIFFERLRLDKKYIKSEKLSAMVDLSKSIVHELKIPLSGIKGFASIVNKKYDDEEIKKYMNLIIKESNRVDQMAGDLLEYSGTSSYKLNLEETNIRELVDKIEKSYKSELEINRIKFQKLIQHDILIKVDKEKIEKVLTSIIKNAIESSDIGKKDKYIKIEVEDDLYESNIFIKDSGVGIKPDSVSKVFEPMFTTKIQGTGLGLTIAKEIIMKHNGNLSVISKLGKETMFTINLIKEKKFQEEE